MCGPDANPADSLRDAMKIEILEDGTISVTTGSFSPQVHKSADEFVEALAEFGGGETKREKRKQITQHNHNPRIVNVNKQVR